MSTDIWNQIMGMLLWSCAGGVVVFLLQEQRIIRLEKQIKELQSDDH